MNKLYFKVALCLLISLIFQIRAVSQCDNIEVNISGDLGVCTNESVQYTAEIDQNNNFTSTSFSWQILDQNQNLVANPFPNPDDRNITNVDWPNTEEVFFIEVSIEGVCEDEDGNIVVIELSDRKTVTVSTPPSANNFDLTANPNPVCIGDRSTLTANDPTDGTVQFAWFLSASNGAPRAIGRTFNTFPIYDDTQFFVEGERNGCKSQTRASIEVTINDNLPSTVVRAVPDTVCLGGVTELNASYEGGGVLNPLPQENFTFLDENQNELANGVSSYTTQPLFQNTTYFIEPDNNFNGCRGVGTQVEIIIIVRENPDPELVNDQVCEEDLPYTIDPDINKEDNTPDFANYLWSTDETSQTIDVNAGTYGLTVTDQFGCIDSGEVTISVFEKPDITLLDTIICDAELEQFQLLLDADNPDARSLPSNPTNPLYDSYKWFQNGTELLDETRNYIIVSGDDIDINRGLEQFTVEIEYGEACFTQSTSDIIVAEPIQIEIDDYKICPNEINFSENINNYPSIPVVGSFARFNWAQPNPDSPEEEESFIRYDTINNTIEFFPIFYTGTYQVTATDVNGCETSDKATVTFYSIPSVPEQDATFCPDDFNNGVSPITLNAEDPEFTAYNWLRPDNTTSDEPSIDVKRPGTYRLIANTTECTVEKTFNIGLYPEPAIGFPPQITLCFEQGQQDLDLGPYSEIEWTTPTGNPDNGSDERVITADRSGQYSVQFTDINNCRRTANTVVDILPELNINVNDVERCDNEGPVILDATGNFNSYEWQFPPDPVTQDQVVSFNPSIEVSDEGIYTIRVSRIQNGVECFATKEVRLTVISSPIILLEDTTVCDNNIPFTLDANPDNKAFTFLWNLGDNGRFDVDKNGTVDANNNAQTSEIDVFEEADYIVTVTDKNGCQTIARSNVDVIDANQVNLGNDIQICKDDFPVTLSPIPSNPAFTYSWSEVNPNTGQAFNTQTLDVIEADQYSVTMTDNNGCITSDNIIVNTFTEPIIQTSSDQSTICNGETTNLEANLVDVNGNNISIGSSFSWQPANEVGQEINVAPNQTTEYTVNIVDANGCVYSDNIVISVIQFPNEDVVSDQEEYCEGDDVVLSRLSGKRFILFDENGNDVNSGNRFQYEILNIQENAEFTYQLLTDNDCVNPDIRSIQIVVNNSPDVSVSGPLTACQNDIIEFEISGVDRLTASHTWELVNGRIGNENGFEKEYQFSSPNTFLIKVTSEIGNCEIQNSQNITINPLPSASVQEVNPKICEGETVTLNANPQGVGLSFNWFTNQNTQTPEVTGPQFTSQTLFNNPTFFYLESTDNNGCVSERAEVEVTVSTTPVASIDAPASTCEGNEVLFELIGPNSGPPSTVKWSGNAIGVDRIGGETGFSKEYQFSYQTPPDNNYRISAEVSLENCSTTIFHDISVNQKPIVTVVGNSDPICEGSSATLIADDNGFGSSFNWIDSDGNQFNGASITTPPLSESTQYTLQTNANNSCQVDDQVVQVVVYNFPLADLTDYDNVCLNQEESWEVVINEPLDYNFSWTASNGQTPSSSNNSGSLKRYLFNSPGIYTISVSVQPKAAPNCAFILEDVFEVLDNPNLVLESTPPFEICQNESIELEISSNVIPLDIKLFNQNGMEVDDAFYDENSSVITLNTGPISNPGNLNYFVVGSNQDNCNSDQLDIPITVNQLPNVTISGNPICNGENASLIGGGAVDYVWDIPVPLAQQNNPNVIVSPSSSTDYRVTGTDANSCVNSFIYRQIVNPIPDIDLQDQVICIGSQTKVINLDPTIFERAIWFDENGDRVDNPSNSSNNGLTIELPLGDNYSVTVEDKNGCRNSDPDGFNITESDNNNVDYTIPSIVVCENELPITLNAGLGYDSYQWNNGQGKDDNGDGNGDGNLNSQFNVVNPNVGTSQYEVSVTQSSCAGIGSVEVIVKSSPNPRIELDPANRSVICEGEQITLSVFDNISGNQVVSDILWSTGSRNAEIEVTPNSFTRYTVEWEINGCLGIDNVDIDVDVLPEVNNIRYNQTDYCEGTENIKLTIDASPSDLTNYTITWRNETKNLDVLSGLNEVEYTISQLNADSTYSVIVESINGCKSNLFFTTVVSKPFPNLTPLDISVACTNNPVELKLVGSDDNNPLINYNWLTTADETSNVRDQRIKEYNFVFDPINTANNQKNIQVEADLDGCLITEEFNINVIEQPRMDKIEVQSGRTQFCQGEQNIVLEAILNTPTSGLIYEWRNVQLNKVVASGVDVITYNIPELEADSTYEVRVFNSNGCSSNTVQFTLSPTPNPVLDVFSSSPLKYCRTPKPTFNIILTAQGADTYQWSAPIAPENQANSSVEVLPENTTTYSVIGTRNGCSSSTTTTIVVSDGPVFTPSASSSGICKGTNAILTANFNSNITENDNLTFTWNPGNQSGSSITVSPNDNTTYTVIAENSNGCQSTKTISIQVEEAPVVTVQDIAFCSGESGKFIANSDQSGTSYNWFDNPSSGPRTLLNSGPEFNVTPSTTTTYQLEASTAVCINEVNIIVQATVFNNPIVNITTDDADNTICSNESITLSANSNPSNVTYEWNPSLKTSASIIENPSSTVTYSVSVLDANGCSATASQGIIVNPIAQVNNPNTDICVNNSATLNGIATNLGGGVTYRWFDVATGGIQLNADETNPNYTTQVFTNSGIETFYLEVESSNGCQPTNRIPFQVIISDIPNVALTDNVNVCSNTPILWEVVGPDAGSSDINWLRSADRISSSDANPAEYEFAAPSASELIEVQVSRGGCQVLLSDVFDVIADPQINLSTLDNIICKDQELLVLNASSDSPNSEFRYYTEPSGGTPVFIDPDKGTSSSYETTVSESTTFYLEVIGNNGCLSVDRAAVSVTVVEPRNLNIVSSSNGLVCVGDDDQLTASPGFTSYTWTPNPSSSTSNSQLVTNISNDISFTVSGIDNNGCSNSASIDINVFDYPVLSLITASPFEACENDDVVLQVESDQVSQIRWFENDLNGSPVFIGENYQLNQVSQNKSFIIEGINNAGCKSKSNLTFDLIVNPLPLINISVSENPICSGEEVTLQASGNYSSYQWNTGETVSSISKNPNQTAVYQVDIIDDKSCENSASATVDVLKLPEPSINDITLCSNDPIILNAGQQFINYEWSTGETSQSISVVDSKDYSVTVEDINGCFGSKTATIQRNELPEFDLDPVSLCGSQLTASIIGPTGFNKYSWNTGELAQNIDVSSEGLYILTVTSLNGCSSTKSIQVDRILEPTVSFSQNKSKYCIGDEIKLQANSTSLSTNFTWRNQNGDILSLDPNLTINSDIGLGPISLEYNTLEQSCQFNSSEEISIQVISVPDISLSVNNPDEICEQDETILIANSTNLAVSELNWFTVNADNTNSIVFRGSEFQPIALNQDTSFFVYNFFEGCTSDTLEVNLIVNPLPRLELLPFSNQICIGQKIDIKAQTQIGNAQINWYSDVSRLNQVFSGDNLILDNLESDTTFYLEAITDKGCTNTNQIFADIQVASSPEFEIRNNNDTICLGESIEFIPESDFGGISYQWFSDENGENLLSELSSFQLDNIQNDSTIYVKAVTQNLVCQNDTIYPVTVFLNKGPIVNFTIQPKGPICAGDDISINLFSNDLSNIKWFKNESGGFPVHQGSFYLIRDIDTSLQFFIEGTTTISDCPVYPRDLVEIQVNPTPDIEFDSDVEFCTNELPLTLSEVNNYPTYEWSNGETTSSVDLIDDTKLILSVVDDLGCENSKSFAPQILESPNINLTDSIVCENEFPIQLSIPNNFKMIVWNEIDTVPMIQADSAGIYSFKVTSQNNCSTIDSIELIQIASPEINLPPSMFICHNEDSVEINAGGQFLDYRWSTGDSTSSIFASVSKIYEVSVTNEVGCISKNSTVVQKGNKFDIDLGNDIEICEGINVVPVGQVVDYSKYIWNTGDSSQYISVRESGEYILTVLDKVGCTATDTIQVELFDSLDFDLGGTIEKCENEVPFTVNPSFDGMVEYKWTELGNDSIISEVPFIRLFGSGTFILEASDELGCPGIDTVKIVVNPLPEPMTPIDTAKCLFEGDSIAIELPSIYTGYLWQDGSTDSLRYFTNTIVQDVELSNQFGCVRNSQVTVEVNSIPNYQVERFDTICFGEYPYRAKVNGISGQFFWSNGQRSNPANLVDTGRYQVQIVLENGCEVNDSIQLSQFPNTNVGLPKELVKCENIDGTIDPTVITANPGYISYQWNTGETSESITVPGTGLFIVTVVDKNGCQKADSTDISRYEEPVFEFETDIIGCPDEYPKLIDGPEGFAQYNWSTGATTEDININSAGNYSITLTSIYGCEITRDVSVSDYSVLDPEFPNDTSLCENTLPLELSVAEGFEEYIWSTTSTESSITVVTGGNYEITVVDDNNCSQNASIKVNIQAIPSSNLPVDQSFCASDIIYLSVPFNNVEWSTGETSPGIYPQSEGLYIVTITEGLCVIQDSSFVNIEDTFNLNLKGDRIVCEGEELVVTADSYTGNIFWEEIPELTCNPCSEQRFSPNRSLQLVGTAIDIEDVDCVNRTDTFEFTYYPVPIIDPVTIPVEQRVGTEFALPKEYSDIQWSTDFGINCDTCKIVEIDINLKFTYEVEFTNSNTCRNTREITFLPIDDCGIEHATAFSPNGDGSNDEIKLFRINDDVVEFDRWSVYNRWGQLMFETTDRDATWDGTVNGQIQEVDVYISILEVGCFGEKTVFKNNIQLLK